jgi:hypothetical protein
MALRNTEQIDIILRSLDENSKAVDLCIVDEGDIEDDAERYSALVHKLGAYVGYIAAEQFAAEFPGTGVEDVTIRVIWLVRPTDSMLEIEGVIAKGEVDHQVPVVFEEEAVFVERVRGSEAGDEPVEREDTDGSENA